jgi:hypothetical protein
MMVIAAQEMGHYADIRRDRAGRPVARHSADISVSRATDNARVARLRDMRHAASLHEQLVQLGLDEAVALEHKLTFYQKHRPKDRETKSLAKRSRRLGQDVIRRGLEHGMAWLADMPSSATPMIQLERMLKDMRFNLAPEASAYRHPNPVVEEAIACAEALARVPQQAVKWNHRVTRALMPSLYHIYYAEVIPEVVASYEALSGQKFVLRYTPPRPENLLQRSSKIWRKIRAKAPRKLP